MNVSIPIDNSIELLDIQQINPLISKCQIKVCYVQDAPNRNGSIITETVARQMAGTLPGSPIVGFYNKETKDFEGHEVKLEYDEETQEYNFVDATFPYGFVDLGAKVWFQDFNDDGVVRKYLCTEGYLWTGQYPECGRILEQGNNQSMELDEKTLQGVWAEPNNFSKRFFIINEAIISKLCVLGDNVEPCFEGANVTAPAINFSLNNNVQERMYSIINEMKNILDKGGFQMAEEEKTSVVFEEEEPEKGTADFEKKPKEEEEGTTVPPEEEEKNSDKESGKTAQEEDEKNQKDQKGKKYNLEEIPEYQELLSKFNDLSASFETLKATSEELKDFKLKAEKKEKEAMIQKFSMLDEEDKKDVVENIDKYSLDEIESKLSVVCFRKKINFNLEEEVDEAPARQYSLTGLEDSNTGAPSWVTMAMAVQKEING